LQVLGLGVAMQLIGPTRFHATQDGDQAGGTGIGRSGQGADEVLLALGTRGQVVDAARRGRQSEAFTGLFDPLAELEHVVTEVLEQHAGDREKTGESVEERESSQGSHEPQAIETAESALNRVLMPRYKGLHGVVSGGGSLGGLFVPYLGQRHLSSPLVAADRPRCGRMAQDMVFRRGPVLKDV